MISEAAVRAALTYIQSLDSFPDFLYADDRNMTRMRRALEAAQQAQVGASSRSHVIDRDELIQEIVRREDQFVIEGGQCGGEDSYGDRELNHGGIADFVIEMVNLHFFTIEEQP